jgi:hypothetical protein
MCGLADSRTFSGASLKHLIEIHTALLPGFFEGRAGELECIHTSKAASFLSALGR